MATAIGRPVGHPLTGLWAVRPLRVEEQRAAQSGAERQDSGFSSRLAS